MQLIDRIKTTSTTTGTGAMTLAAAPTGYRLPGAATVVPYVIDSGGADWEIGHGTMDGTTLTRTQVWASSSGGAVNFGAGTKTIVVGAIAFAQVVVRPSGFTPPVASGSGSIAGGTSAVASGGTDIALGNAASSTGANGISIGVSSVTSSTSNIAIGNAANATAGSSNSIAIGTGSQAAGGSAMGNAAIARKASSVAIGDGAQVPTSASGSNQTALGAGAIVDGSSDRSVALGSGALVSGKQYCLSVLRGRVAGNSQRAYSGITARTIQRLEGELTAQTTDATPTLMTTVSGEFALTSGASAMCFTAHCVARNTANQEMMAIRIDAAVRSGTLVNATQIAIGSPEASLSGATIAVTMSSNTVRFTVTGIAATTIRWGVSISGVEDYT